MPQERGGREMSLDNKKLLSWICCIVGFFAFAIIFNSIGIYLGMQIKEESDDIKPLIANVVVLILGIMSGLLFL